MRQRNGIMIEPAVPCYVHFSRYLCPDEMAFSGDEIRTVDDSFCKALIPDANVRRRMGHLLRIAAGCGLDALKCVDSKEVAGIITSTGLGFMKDTVSFENMIIDRKEELLNPSPFMQSTFNTASGYIALMRGIRAYNTAYVHRAGGFAASMVDAFLLLSENSGKGVLVGGFDEATREVDVLRRRLGCWKKGDGFMPLGEGAGFMYLSSETSSVKISGVCPDGRAALAADSGSMDNVEVFRCSSYVGRTGAFQSILSVVVSIVLESGFTGRALICDDVNPDGPAILIFKQ